MASFEVTPSQLKTTADQLESLNANFKAAAEGLSSTQQQLSAMWEGESKAAFQNAFERDRANMDAFYANISKFVAALRAMAAKYEAAEAQNTQTATSRSY